MRNTADNCEEEIGFLLIPEFPIYALILATEALRIANQNAASRLFGWHFISMDGRPVTADSGMSLQPDLGVEALTATPALAAPIPTDRKDLD